MFCSGFGYEAIGIIDLDLPTVAVYAKSTYPTSGQLLNHNNIVKAKAMLPKVESESAEDQDEFNKAARLESPGDAAVEYLQPDRDGAEDCGAAHAVQRFERGCEVDEEEIVETE